MARKKFFKTLAEARRVKKERFDGVDSVHVYRLPKDTPRHGGEYVVCTHLEYLNPYII